MEDIKLSLKKIDVMEDIKQVYKKNDVMEDIRNLQKKINDVYPFTKQSNRKKARHSVLPVAVCSY